MSIGFLDLCRQLPRWRGLFIELLSKLVDELSTKIVGEFMIPSETAPTD